MGILFYIQWTVYCNSLLAHTRCVLVHFCLYCTFTLDFFGFLPRNALLRTLVHLRGLGIAYVVRLSVRPSVCNVGGL